MGGLKDDTGKNLGSPDESLINKNSKANPDQARQWDDNDPQKSNVDPLKKQFERNNLQADREKMAGSGGGGLDPDRNSGDR